MATSSKKIEEQIVAIERLERATVTLYLLGASPLVLNRMSKKARETLLLPARRTNKAARERKLKHDPVAEFRESIYRCRDPQAPTYIHFPKNAFKKALAQAAIDIPGATKAEVGRLVKVVDETVHVYGKPFLYMDVVRQAGTARTPDIRTRAMIPNWALQVTFQYVRQHIREQDLVNLTDAAGQITGIGDGRTEKGTFDYGCWEIVNADDERWNQIVDNYGREAQVAAMEHPECIDEDTEELLAWYEAEVIRREAKPEERPAKTVKARNGKGKDKPQEEAPQIA